MAQHRMISLKIVDSGKFIKMPVTEQALYFQLCVHADDDGVVEAYNILKCCEIKEESLMFLENNGYIKILDDNLVTYIIDWTVHNKIRCDRKVDSIYKDLLLSVLPDIQLRECRERSDIKNKKSTMSDNGLTMDRHMSAQVKLSKDKIKHKYGEYNHVLLTKIEYEKLHDDFPNADELIKHLDEYIEMKGYKCKSCNLAIRKWVVQAVDEKNNRKLDNTKKEPNYNLDLFDKLAVNVR